MGDDLHSVPIHRLGAGDWIHAESVGVFGCQGALRDCYVGFPSDGSGGTRTDWTDLVI